MKLLIASDLHGSATACKKLLDTFTASGADRLILLGDLLYHGPRNDLPEGYDPKAVIALLSEQADKLFCVRGNCDSEVDQMMLAYPIMSDYSTVWADGQRFFLTHGHIWNGGNVPPVTAGTILAHGHTHIPTLEEKDGLVIFNPGSIAIPKQENLPTYGVWENGMLSVRSLADGSVYREMIRNIQ